MPKIIALFFDSPPWTFPSVKQFLDRNGFKKTFYVDVGRDYTSIFVVLSDPNKYRSVKSVVHESKGIVIEIGYK